MSQKSTQNPECLLYLLPAPLTRAPRDAGVTVPDLLAVRLAGGAVVELERARLEAVALLGAPFAGMVVGIADRPVGAIAAVDRGQVIRIDTGSAIRPKK